MLILVLTEMIPLVIITKMSYEDCCRQRLDILKRERQTLREGRRAIIEAISLGLVDPHSIADYYNRLVELNDQEINALSEVLHEY